MKIAQRYRVISEVKSLYQTVFLYKHDDNTLLSTVKNIMPPYRIQQSISSPHAPKTVTLSAQLYKLSITNVHCIALVGVKIFSTSYYMLMSPYSFRVSVCSCVSPYAAVSPSGSATPHAHLNPSALGAGPNCTHHTQAEVFTYLQSLKHGHLTQCLHEATVDYIAC